MYAQTATVIILHLSKNDDQCVNTINALNLIIVLFCQIRNPFGTHKNKNRNTGTNQTTGHRNQTGAYSELNVGAIIATGGTTDTENQYDALKHHDNYINMKCIGEKGTVKTSESKDCYININYVGNIN